MRLGYAVNVLLLERTSHAEQWNLCAPWSRGADTSNGRRVVPGADDTTGRHICSWQRCWDWSQGRVGSAASRQKRGAAGGYIPLGVSQIWRLMLVRPIGHNRHRIRMPI